MTDDDLRDYFSAFGELVKVYGLRDAAEEETKGFGFLEYLTTDPVPKILDQRFHFIKGNKIEATKFIKNRLNAIDNNTSEKETHLQVEKKQPHYAAPENGSRPAGYNHHHYLRN